jgi:hypothetical protein
MADQKISELTPAPTLSGNEEFPFALSGANGSATSDVIATYVASQVSSESVGLQDVFMLMGA